MTIEQPEPGGVSWAKFISGVLRVVIEIEAELIAIEGDGPVDSAVLARDRDHHHFQRPIHYRLFSSASSFS